MRVTSLPPSLFALNFDRTMVPGGTVSGGGFCNSSLCGSMALFWATISSSARPEAHRAEQRRWCCGGAHARVRDESGPPRRRGVHDRVELLRGERPLRPPAPAAGRDRATGSQILELAKSAQNLFIRQDPREQARLRKTLVSNSTFDRGSLSAANVKPFDLLVDANESGIWLGVRDSS
jgi:hypothetical protein